MRLMQDEPLQITQFTDIRLFKRGKVRDVYDMGDKLLIISTDRLSCFDVILPTPIPDKGKLLTRLSIFWFNFTKNIIPNHLISADINDFPRELDKYKQIIDERSMLVKKTKPIPIECVVRGYISGSGWKEYKENQSICGVSLPKGLRESDKLPEPIFTPATKEDIGHDINVTLEYSENHLGKETALRLKDISLTLYKKTSLYADSKGIIIADTKFEFGFYNGDIILIDEVLTPDSSRFWPKDGYAPGGPQTSFDKQFVRDYLERSGWDKTPPAPKLPYEIIQKTAKKYLEAYQRLTEGMQDTSGRFCKL